MSLFSIMSGSTSTSTSSTAASSLTASPLQQLLASDSDDDDSLLSQLSSLTSSSSSTTGVTITASAQVLAATQADASKDAATIATDTRATLDAQNAGTNPDLSQLSPRALGVMVLNGSNTFTPSEVLAAKKELKSREVDEFKSAISGGLTLDALKAYQTQRQTDASSMSTEEAQARAMMGETWSSSSSSSTASS